MMQECLLIHSYYTTFIGLPTIQLARQSVFMVTLPTPLRVRMQGPFRYGVLTPQMQQYNTEMSAVRSSVEWLFGDVINSFKFNDFKKDLKLFLSSVGKIYVVSVILRNAMTCLYGNMTSEFFDLRPPTLDTYFG